MASETESDHHHLSGRATPLQPDDGRGDIRKVWGRGGVLVPSSFLQILIGVAEVKIRSRASKQGNGQGWNAVGGQAISGTAEPGVHAEHLRQHDSYTFRNNKVSISR